MTLSTKYNSGQSVFTVVGIDDKAKIVTTLIQSININAAISGIKTIYNCSINREETETVSPGLPIHYTIERTENKIFETKEECIESMIPKKK